VIVDDADGLHPGVDDCRADELEAAPLQVLGDPFGELGLRGHGNPVAAQADTVLKQGTLEASNTDMAQAMTDMIEAQRTYQLTSKAIQTADQMMEIANGVKR